MRDSSLLEVLKLLASVATPVAIAVFGIIIDKTIQRQNAIGQRQSSWRTRWADDFLKAASGFNESAKKFMWVYITAEWDAEGNVNVPGAKDLPNSFQDEALPRLRELNKG